MEDISLETYIKSFKKMPRKDRIRHSKPSYCYEVCSRCKDTNITYYYCYDDGTKAGCKSKPFLCNSCYRGLKNGSWKPRVVTDQYTGSSRVGNSWA